MRKNAYLIQNRTTLITGVRATIALDENGTRGQQFQ